MPSGPFSSRPRGATVAVFALIGGLCVALTATPAAAAPIEVTTTDDGGAGSLREAVAQASADAGPDEIVLQPGATYQLDDCAAGELDHTDNDELSISGNGATIVQTCPDERVLASAGDVVLDEVTITGGSTPGLGGGVSAGTASVTLVRSTVSGNNASSGGGVAGIRVTLEASTLSGNAASATGGAVFADQVMSATNSTITGNDAGASGGGVVVVNDTLSLEFSTVVGNSAPTGANLEVQAGGDELAARGSVIASPVGGDDCALAAGVATTTLGGNVTSDDSCGVGAGPGDLTGVADVGLAPLADNGGPTPTRAPTADSVVVDRSACGTVASDQRGFARPQGVACDSGSVELEGVTPPPGPPPTGPPPTGSPGPPTDAPRGPAARSEAPLRFTG